MRGATLVGKKVGMMRFAEGQAMVSATVLQFLPNRVVRVGESGDGKHQPVELTWGEVKAKKLSKPLRGYYAKHGVVAGEGLKTFAFMGNDLAGKDEITLDIFADVRYVDITGTSKGKGFAGGVKRHNFRMQDATHGNSLSHRVIGSTGQNQTPGKVFKGKKMPGHMGSHKVTTMNLRVLDLDVERHMLVVAGAVPGANGSEVWVRRSVKKSQHAATEDKA